MTVLGQTDGLSAGLIRVNEAALWLGISRAGVYRLLNDGQLKSIRIGAARLIPREEMVEFAHRRIEEEGSNG